MQKFVARWNCPACGTEGFGFQAPPHDRPDGRSCRPSGQKSEASMRSRGGVDYAIAMPISGHYVSSLKRPTEPSERLGCARWFRDLRTVRHHAARLGGVVVKVPTDTDAALGGGCYYGPWRC